MHKKLRITVEGKVYDVTVEELTETGTTAPAYPSIAGTGASTVSTSGPLAAPMPAAPPPAAPAFPASTPPAPPAIEGTAAGAVVCPLGGVVDSVDVTKGQTVAAGDRIAVIEAMKMKTPIHAQAGGTVTSIAVKPGDAVEAGAVLLTIA